MQAVSQTDCAEKYQYENSERVCIRAFGSKWRRKIDIDENIVRDDAGRCRGSIFDGKIWSRKCIERIGALIELPPVYENLSAVDNLKVRTWTLGISDARILEVLDIVDLKNTGKSRWESFPWE